MRAFVQRGVFVLLTLLAVRGDDLRGQWKMVRQYAPAGDAIIFNDGIIWAAAWPRSLALTATPGITYSMDTGKTWTDLLLPTYLNPRANFLFLDIAFANKDTGVIALYNADPSAIQVWDWGGIYRTTDRGKTWSRVDPSNSKASRLTYNHSSSVIHFVECIYGSTATSLDGGMGWNSVQVTGSSRNPGVLTALTTAKDGTVYALGSDSYQDFFGRWIGPPLSNVFSSTDRGTTWQRASGQVSLDSWSIDVDSCDPSRLYVVNEDIASRFQGFSSMYVSPDRGTTWTTAFTLPYPGLAGSFSTAPHALYAATITNGILRSTDHGTTWQNIGGPGNPPDSRNICAINDNILFAVDSDGNIWSTSNSGGDSVLAPSGSVPLTITPDSLFAADTTHCEPITRSVTVSANGCNTASLDSSWLAGADAEAFSVGTRNGVFIPVTFHGTRAGDYNAKFILQISNGTFDTIALEGHAVGTYPLNIITADTKTDIIGGDLSVPITVSGLKRPETIDLVLHYDPILAYNSSVDPANTTLDIPGEQWPGRSKLHIAQASSGVVAGYARFNVFADSGTKPQVTFDSLTVLSAISPCEYTLPAAVTSTITLPTGCGTTILSQYLQSGQVSVFTIRPNPTSGDVELTSSLDIGDASVEIYDMLGVRRGALAVKPTKETPAHLLLPEGAGVYYLRVKSQVGVQSLRVVVAK
ncbi:MAG: T9SS type A sorting domain-containing protein [Bacteroidota bacterium]|nr:T9SS type A sorting domain-containing protein [Bacteroidota bacterium]MDP4234016.1 T9SS type A sorting domain-containing protein [Bacteroidota bacterium]MDP4242882.1 T9SS type A sorting domain-containing protein [Bacteroidota bacterium]MDP4287679.1 T9SS type A sorting domain-containing protein [Bacteroidota bacterium]